MQQLDDSEIISRLTSDTKHHFLKWENGFGEAKSYFPELHILRAFKSITGMQNSDYFLSIEFLGQRYNPDYDTYSNENAFMVAFIGNGVVGHVIVESSFPKRIDISPLINEIAFQVSNAFNSISSFMNMSRDYD